MLPVIPLCFCPAGLEVAADPDDEHTIEYAFNLPDGVPSRFRYEYHEGQPLLRFRVPNRTVEANDDFALTACALRVASRFAAPHAVIEFTDEGKAAFIGYPDIAQCAFKCGRQGPSHQTNKLIFELVALGSPFSGREGLSHQTNKSFS